MKPIPGKAPRAAKNYIKPLLAIMVCVLLVYTSCRKSESNLLSPTKSSTDAVSTDTLVSQLAVNLAKSLSGGFGGVNVMDGVDSVSLGNHRGIQHGSNNNSLCGFFTDSLVNYTHTLADTTSHTGGNLTFYFDCTNGKSTGYTAYDSLGTTSKRPDGSTFSYVKQYYTIKCLNNNYQFVGVNGDIYYYYSTTTLCSCNQTYTTIQNVNYVLKDLTINVCGCSRDILSGTASFKAYGRNWSLIGTMTFLGNYQADMLINGVTYHVNLKTHKVTT